MGMRRGIILATAIATASIGAMALTTSTASAATSATYNVWDWNVAGNTMHHGSTADGMVDGAVSSIRNRNTNFAAVNELCYGQYQAIQSKLAAAGWPQDKTNFSRWAVSQAPASSVCNGNEEYGNAIFSKAPLGAAYRTTLADDGTTEKRNLMCAPLQDTPKVRFCVTHISPKNYGTQLPQVLRYMEDRHDNYGETVVLAGDLNVQPTDATLNSWYYANTVNNGGNSGRYDELDDSDSAYCLGYGEWTSTGNPPGGITPPCSATQPQPKIDFIFVRQDRISNSYSADSLAISTSCTGIPATNKYPSGSCSDHRILTGTVSVFTS